MEESIRPRSGGRRTGHPHPLEVRRLNVRRHVVTSIVGNAALPIAAIVTAPILALRLGLEGRGQLAAATAPLLLMTTIATIGVPESLTHHVAMRPAWVGAIYRRSLGALFMSGIVASVATIFLAEPLSENHQRIRLLIAISALAIVPTTLIAGLRGVSSGLHAWGTVNNEKYVSSGVRVVGIVILASSAVLTPLSATLVISFSPVLAGVCYWNIARSLRRTDVTERPPDHSTILRYASRMWIGSLAGILLSRLDQVLMIPLANTRQLGLYAVAVNIADIILILNNAVRDVTFSADSADHRDARLQASARIASLGAIIFGIVISIPLAWILPLVFGESFRGATLPALILIWAAVLGTPGSIAGAGLSARGRPGLRSLSLVFAAIVNIVALLVLVPSYGALGAAYATFIGSTIAGTTNIYLLRKLFAIPMGGFYGLRSTDLDVVRRARDASLRVLAPTRTLDW
jgi:O-antigen/teichoic acid export membrane protein